MLQAQISAKMMASFSYVVPSSWWSVGLGFLTVATSGVRGRDIVSRNINVPTISSTSYFVKSNFNALNPMLWVS